jgi:hypothetical protein
MPKIILSFIIVSGESSIIFPKSSIFVQLLLSYDLNQKAKLKPSIVVVNEGNVIKFLSALF